MAVDNSSDAEGATPKPKKKPARKGRKSALLDISALTSSQAALAALEGQHLLHLKLRKRYYAEALSFIRQIEGAFSLVQRLLASTSKAEVLECMEFFKTAWEYQLEIAEVWI